MVNSPVKPFGSGLFFVEEVLLLIQSLFISLFWFSISFLVNFDNFVSLQQFIHFICCLLYYFILFYFSARLVVMPLSFLILVIWFLLSFFLGQSEDFSTLFIFSKKKIWFPWFLLFFYSFIYVWFYFYILFTWFEFSFISL